MVTILAVTTVCPALGQNTGPTTQFTVANKPPDAENAYCGPGNVAKFGAKDGPAQLPQKCYYTALEATPSPGKQIKVGPNADLAETVANAKCGETLLLSAGAVYGIKDFPRKNCDDQHYITIRPDTPDSKLPPEGTRISPAWGGVASLPGRPAYAQPSGGAAKLMAAVASLNGTGITLGDHYRFIAIEWIASPDRKVVRLLFTNGSDHIVLDRNWMHGTDGQEMGRGLNVNGANYVAVIHSYFNSFTCMAVTGTCTDAAAIGGGNGDIPIFALKIVDNFLESSGENIIFGGGAATVHPEDVEIRRNYFFKPTFWNRNSPDHTEPTPIVKNLFELKNAKRVLFEANLLENSWPGFSQTGPAIVLTPRNNLNKALGRPTCPDCEVSDITIRYVWIRKVHQVLQLANVFDVGKPSPGYDYSIHDVVADGLSYPECGKGCGGAMNLLSGGPGGSPAESIMHDVAVDHVTYVSMQRPRTFLGMGGPPAKNPNDPQMRHITWTNTVGDAGVYGTWPSGGTPDWNCSNLQGSSPKSKMENCWKDSVFRANLLVGGNAIRGQRGEWPDGNYFVDSQEAIGYVKLNGGLDGDYHLGPSSKFRGKGTDGRDPGADIDAVLQGIKGVR
jgi:hypothetical protein